MDRPIPQIQSKEFEDLLNSLEALSNYHAGMNFGFSKARELLRLCIKTKGESILKEQGLTPKDWLIDCKNSIAVKRPKTEKIEKTKKEEDVDGQLAKALSRMNGTKGQL